MDDGAPNQGTCLINQKLQMLNCCIQQKIKREQQQNEAEKLQASDEVRRNNPPKSDSSDEDEFFDAQEETNDAIDENGERTMLDRVINLLTFPPNADLDGQITVAEGRLHQLDDLTLLDSGEPLYVPVTQEPAPMTEDMLQEQADIMYQLGTSAEGAALRAKMQSAGLFSDMEAFKAANPGCKLEDFVRWYSPRDYDDEHGLSQRMQAPGNTWQDCWAAARPVPVNRQKRLFDYTKEAEKVLHYLAAFTLDDIVKHFMPVLIHSAVSQVTRERDVVAELSDAELPLRINDIVKCSMSGNFLAATTLIRDAELKLFQCLSLRRKFAAVHEIDRPDVPLDWLLVKKFVVNLVNRPEVEVTGAAVELVKGLFKQSQRLIYEEKTPIGERHADDVNKLPVLGAPFAKEFILRTKAPRPAAYSKHLPQRMYCCISANEFRVAGSFCEDALYF